MRKEHHSGDVLTPEQIESIFHSPEANKLLTQIQTNHQSLLSEIKTYVQSGNMEKVKSMLHPITADQETQKLLQSIRNQIG